MATTHTPGPWHTETRHTVTAICCKPTRKGEWPELCHQERNGHPEHGSITGRMRTSGELEANARLIAAAPDLLEALQYIVLWNRDDWDAERARDLARSAIAKASGN